MATGMLVVGVGRATRLLVEVCGGTARTTPWVAVDGSVLPRADEKDAATIAAQMRATVAQGRPA